MNKARFFLRFPDYFHAKGRISRLQYLVFTTACLIISFSSMAVLVAFRTPFADYAGASIPWLVMYSLVIIAWLYFGYCLQAKRLHDISWPAALAFAWVVQVLIIIAAGFAERFAASGFIAGTIKNLQLVCNAASLIIGLFALFKPGDKGPNKHGADPLQSPQTDPSVF